MTALLLGAMVCVGMKTQNAGAAELPECCRPKDIEGPRVVVITFRTETSEASRALAPVLSQAADELTSAPVLFVTFDFSTPRLTKQSEYLCKSLGLEGVWKMFPRQSGFAVIVDGETGKATAKITHFENLDRVRAEIAKLLES